MHLYGRQDILETLNKRADGLAEGYRQNIAIIGEELIGKTYLIQHWLSSYCNNYVVPVYLEVKTQEQEIFPQKFIGTLLYSFLRNSQVTLKDDIGFLVEKAQGYIPNTLKLANEILCEHRKTKMHESFFRLLVLAESFYEETNKRCCIILDEFHCLEEFKIKDLYPHWRKHLMLAKNTMYILISSKRNLASKIIACDLNLLFGNFERIELEPFSVNVAQQFVKDRLGCLNADQALLDFIVDFNGCRPFYLDIFCNAFLDYHRENQKILPSISSLCQAIENTFLDDWGIFNKRFLELLKDVRDCIGDPLAFQLLIALSGGSNRLSELAHVLHKTKKEASRLLACLEPLYLVSKTAEIYLLNDRVFSFWVNSVYATRLNTYDITVDKQRRIFKDRIEFLYSNFNKAQAKGLSTRILELFNQFGNESVQIQKKLLRLNHFKEVKLFNINGNKIKEGILGRAANSLWIAGIKEDRVAEEDITEFIDVCKRLRGNKAQKKIFITFNELDLNAKLIAKEKKVMTWDLGCLNSLLEIYGKPRIVR